MFLSKRVRTFLTGHQNLKPAVWVLRFGFGVKIRIGLISGLGLGLWRLLWWVRLRLGARQAGPHMDRSTRMCIPVFVFHLHSEISRLTTTASWIQNQTLGGWEWHQTCESFSPSVYVQCAMLSEKWDQAMRVSAGAERIFDIILSVDFYFWHNQEFFSFQPDKGSPSAFPLSLRKSRIFLFFFLKHNSSWMHSFLPFILNQLQEIG